MTRMSQAFRVNKRLAERIWGRLSPSASASLKVLTSSYSFWVGSGDIISLEGRWYVTHTGLLRLGASQAMPRYPCRGRRFAV